MTVQTEVFVGTQANTTILDLTVYFQNKFEAALTDQGRIFYQRNLWFIRSMVQLVML